MRHVPALNPLKKRFIGHCSIENLVMVNIRLTILLPE